MRARCLCAIVVVAVSLRAVTAARADFSPEESRKQAKTHFALGKMFTEAGNYQQAIVEYLAAYELAPLPALLFNLGEVYRLSGDRRKALDHYKRYLVADPEGAGSATAREQVELLKVQIHREDDALAEKQAEARAAAAENERQAEAARAERERSAGTHALILISGPPTPRKKPLVKQPWFWGVVAGTAIAVAGVSIGIGVGLSGTRGPSPSFGTFVLR
jgi:tetratricopeptide (TPR) repeat protein